MLAYFFHHGLVVVINATDEKATEPRALEIAADRFKKAGINETPSISGVATLPQSGVIVTWNDPPSRADDVEDTIHNAIDAEVEQLRSEMQEEIDRQVTRVEQRIDDLEVGDED